MKHYTYRITNIIITKHYYGTRSTNLDPINDLGTIYYSSSTDKEFIKDQIQNPQNYKYKIINIYDNRKSAMELEIKLHNKFNVGINKNFYNKSKQTSSGFDTTGTHPVFSEEHKNKIAIKSKNKSKSCRKLISKKVTLDWANMSEVKYKLKCEAISKSLKGKSQPEWKNKQHSKRMEGKGNSMAKRINIYDASDNLMFETYGNFSDICLSNNLPKASLANSYRNDTKIYSHKRSLADAKRNGYESYVGWYAKVI